MLGFSTTPERTNEPNRHGKHDNASSCAKFVSGTCSHYFTHFDPMAPQASKARKTNKDGKLVRHKSRKPTYKSHILRLVKQIHPKLHIGKRAMNIMNNMATDLVTRLSADAGEIASIAKRQTLTSAEVQASVKMIMPGDLVKHSLDNLQKAVTIFIQSRD